MPEDISQNQQQNRNLAYPDQIKSATSELASTVRVLLEIPKSISVLRRTLRGEALYQSQDGVNQWVQVVKPAFVLLDPLTRQPIKKLIKMPDGEERLTYVPNDEAIEEVLSMLSFMGMNHITALTNLSDDNILDDLKEFECKLAALLTLKQVQWGLDKALMPMIMTKVKTVIQDARYLCINGVTMKALTQQVSRIEQIIEGDKNIKKVASMYS